MEEKEIEKRVLELYEMGKGTKEIRRELGIPFPEIRQYLRNSATEGKIKQNKNNKDKVGQDNKEKTRQLYEEGKSVEEIAEEIGLSIQTVKRYINLLIGGEKIQDRPKKTTNKKEEYKKQVEELYIRGAYIKEISDKLGIPIATINTYIRELKNEGKIQKDRKSNPREDIDIISNKKELSRNDYAILNRYMTKCKGKVKEGKLKKEELSYMKKTVNMTNKYDHIVTYIKACIRFNEIQEAEKILTSYIDDKEQSEQKRKKFKKLLDQLKEIERKKMAIRMLKTGNGVQEVVKQTGVPEVEVIEIKQKIDGKVEGINPTPEGR